MPQPGGRPDDDGKGELESRHARRKHDDRADDECRDAGHADDAEGPDMDLRHHQSNAEQHKRRARIVDRQQVERVERDQQADAPDQPWCHRPRIEKFKYQSVDAEQHQEESHVRIGDHGE